MIHAFKVYQGKAVISSITGKTYLSASYFARHWYVTHISFVFNCMSFLCHPSIICVSLVCLSYVLVCHSYVPRMYSYVIRMSLVCIRMSLVCTRMLFVCHSYILACHSYVLVCHSYVTTRMSLVCVFTMNPSAVFVVISEQM